MARDGALDAARALTMVFVVAGHASVSYMVTPIGWAVQDSSRHLAVDLVAWIIRAFAMPVFFWLSGYAARGLLARGVRGYLRNRATRILVPFASALVPCSIAISELWDWGRTVTARDALAPTVPRFQGSELPIMLAHLWFLYYLLLISAAALVVATAARRLRLAAPRPLALAVPAVLTTGVLVHLGALHTDTPLSFVPDPAIAIYMAGFFAWGWLVHAHRDQLARYAHHAWHALAAALPLLGIVIFALHRGAMHGEPPPVHASVASGLFSLAVIVALLGLCVRHAADPPALVQLGARASYWIYIAHFPFVVLLQILFAMVALPGPLEYVAIVALTTAFCLATYRLAARPRPLVKLRLR
jgi:glucans biosynthesis protein C